ncbi:hypothetical protein FMH15_16905 [Vibrio alginolyticus]|jgi:hypothetical protein|uniref:hypothetical protein n=1 Tax=Vibrio harveyi group TaxID=717610 RepID=UPI001C9CF890|nr:MULTISPECIES: hypothetical protein [Vibrio harveyi group]EGR0268310.1 hypothetical protein [Vibrio alginolyticus]ELH9641288.1 hypothetical protein [Vibrio alginolyticus]MBY7685787.1 hypothetical protein [Vibrio alginolyticus]MCR9713912.1 hypothetical protein [Vibrio parahaemolyticus]MDF4876209.1 hypothetical protein [Vibrio parahaemolyticus]
MTKHHPLAAILDQSQRSLPTTRQGAVALKKLEMALTPYPAYFREVQNNALEDIRETHPDAAEQIEHALEAAQQALELHCHGLKMVSHLLNND